MALEVDAKEFSTQVIEASYQRWILVDFWAPWCGPCLALAPVLKEITNEFADKLLLAKVNTEENPQLAQQFGIRSIPHVKLFKDGKVVDEFLGNLPKQQISHFLQKHIPSELTLKLQLCLEQNNFDMAIDLLSKAGSLTAPEEKILWELTRAQMNQLPAAKEKILRLMDFLSPVTQLQPEKALLKKTLNQPFSQNYLPQLADILNEERQEPILSQLLTAFDEARADQKEALKELLLTALAIIGNDKEIVNEYRKKLTRLLY